MDLIILGGLVLGLVQLFKTTFGVTSRYIPILTLILSAVLVSVFLWINKVPVSWEIIQDGLIIALSAMGLWSGTKSTIGK